MRLRASGTKSQEESLSTSVRYEESIRMDFVGQLQSHAIGGLVLVPLVLGIKLVGLHPTGTKSRAWRSGPRSSGMRLDFVHSI